MAIQRVMAIMAHPDDAEFGCGGTVAKWAKEGREVSYVIATNGDKGTSDLSITSEQLVKIREDEQRKAASTLGVERVIFLGYPDGELADTRDFLRDVVRVIRQYRPDLVICQNPNRTLNPYASHRDHRICGGVVLDAVYPYSRDRLSFPELGAQGLPTHRVQEVYLTTYPDPDIFVDITETIDLKIKALRCHASQVGNREEVEGWVRQRATEVGRSKGFPYAEAFRRIDLFR